MKNFYLQTKKLVSVSDSVSTSKTSSTNRFMKVFLLSALLTLDFLSQAQLLIPFTGSTSLACGTNTLIEDHAGNANYANNANGYVVIDGGFQGVVNLQGNYSVESNWDYIRIYNGIGIGGTLLNTYTGIGFVNFTSTPGQTITVRFSSDGSVIDTGFSFTCVATGACFMPPPCSISLIPSSNPICSGNSATLTTDAASGILWNTGSTTNSIVVTPTATTVYSVTGTSTAACIASNIVTVTVQNPSISVSSSTAGICVLGNLVTLTGVGASTYTWSGVNPTNTNTIVVSPTVTTTYSLSGTNSCGTYSTTQTVAVLASTIVATSSSSAICLGNAATLTASGATTYTWMPGNIVGTNAIVSPTANTIFSVSGTNSIGCIYNSTTQATAIIVNPNPIVNSTSNSNYSICPSTPVILNGIGANTYTWSSGVINGVAFPSPSSSFVYTVTGTNTLTGCTNTATAIVYVYSTSITISPSPSICSGSSATLSASGALNYTWTGNNTTLPFQNPVVSPIASAVYTVNAITSNYCPISGTVAVTVNPSPVITAVSNKTSFCRGESSLISVSGASTYLWSNGATTPSITVSPTVTSYYTVNGVSNNCNSNTASILLTVNFCTSIDKNGLIQNNISVYPNPNNGEFTIMSNEAISLDLINQLGQVVKVITLNETNNHQANISNVANGIYFIVGKGTNGSMNQKVIVNK